jgi:hypothetical protein
LIDVLRSCGQETLAETVQRWHALDNFHRPGELDFE